MHSQTFRINGIDYTFTEERLQGVEVVVVRYTQNGESFADWSAEAPMPATQEEAEVALTELGWATMETTTTDDCGPKGEITI